MVDFVIEGITQHFRVRYDAEQTPAAIGSVLGNALLKSCEDDYSRLRGIFRAEIPKVITVTVHTGAGGHQNGED